MLSYNLALCYYQLGDRPKALEYLGKAKPGTVEPKQKEKLQQLLTYVTTGENGFAMNDSEKDRIIRVNQLADSIGLDASLEDESGAEESFFEGDATAPDSSGREASESGTPESGPASRHAQRQSRRATDRVCATRWAS